MYKNIKKKNKIFLFQSSFFEIKFENFSRTNFGLVKIELL